MLLPGLRESAALALEARADLTDQQISKMPMGAAGSMTPNYWRKASGSGKSNCAQRFLTSSRSTGRGGYPVWHCNAHSGDYAHNVRVVERAVST